MKVNDLSISRLLPKPHEHYNIGKAAIKQNSSHTGPQILKIMFTSTLWIC